MSKEEHYIWVKPLYGKTEKEMKENIKRLEKENDKILDEICQDYINLQSQLDIANRKLDKIKEYCQEHLINTYKEQDCCEEYGNLITTEIQSIIGGNDD
jgi:replicative DNA helicase